MFFGLLRLLPSNNETAFTVYIFLEEFKEQLFTVFTNITFDFKRMLLIIINAAPGTRATSKGQGYATHQGKWQYRSLG